MGGVSGPASYVYIFFFLYVVYIYIYTYIYSYIFIFILILICVYIYIYIYVCVYIYMVPPPPPYLPLAGFSCSIGRNLYVVVAPVGWLISKLVRSGCSSSWSRGVASKPWLHKDCYEVRIGNNCTASKQYESN